MISRNGRDPKGVLQETPLIIKLVKVGLSKVEIMRPM